jgi:hypothetical protein
VEEFEEIIPTTGALPDLYLSNYKEKFKKIRKNVKHKKCFLVVALVGVQWRARARPCRAVVVDGLAAGYWLDVSVFGHLDDQESVAQKKQHFPPPHAERWRQLVGLGRSFACIIFK